MREQIRVLLRSFARDDKSLRTPPSVVSDHLDPRFVDEPQHRPPEEYATREAVIRILQREWAYAYICPISRHRARALSGWTRWYNKHRRHGSLDAQPPITRVAQAHAQNI